MSGIVNIITKDGDFSKYSGSLSANMGDYVILQDDLFPEVDKTNWNNISDIQANFEGPVINNKLSFFVSGRNKTNNGYLLAKECFIRIICLVREQQYISYRFHCWTGGWLHARCYAVATDIISR